jgi:hypothetical protein
MKLNKMVWSMALAAALVFAVGKAASGLVLDKGTDQQKLRKNIDKQTQKFAICVGKAALACEAAGTSGAPECDLTGDGMPMPGTVPAEAITALAEDLAKCESKLDLSKKGSDYAGIGCPGDCDAVTLGDQSCGTMASFQAYSIDNTYFQIEGLGAILSGVCGGDNTCFNTQGELGVKYSKAVFKCITKCENDYKNKKGNGGDNDTLANCDPNTSADANFQACITKAEGKAPGIIAGFRDGLDNAISDGRDDLYDEAAPVPCP